MSIVMLLGIVPARILSQIKNLDFTKVAEAFPIIEEALEDSE